jgi:hypothetical protein
MQDLYLRLGQGTPLTYAQEDLNFKRIKAAIDSLETAVAGAGTGTVTSVGLSLPNIFTVSGSPVISSGSLTATLASQSANRIFSSPNGSSGQPTFRALVAADLPTVTIAKGGTGLTSVITNNYILASNGTGYEGRLVTVGTGLTLTTGTGSMAFALNLAAINLSSLGGILGPTNGGTNQNSYTTGDILYASATNTLSKLPIGAAGRVLTVSLGGIPTWAVPTASGVTSIEGTTGAINLSSSEITFTVPTAGEVNLAIATATGSVKGLLSSTDWTTFNDKATLISGTTNYLTKVTGAKTIGNSRVFDNGTNMGFGTASPSTDFHFYTANVTTDLRVEAASSSSIQLYDSSALKLTISSGGTIKTWATGSSLTLTSDASAGGIVIAGTTGNTTIRKGFGISNFGYWNVAGTYTFSSNELYGVILGTGSSNTLNIALPSSPFNGQEICIMTEKSNTITLTSASTIYGHATIAFNIASGTAMCLAKFSTATGTGSWFISSS